MRRALYVVAFIAAVLGAIRAKAVYSETVFFADPLVIFCLIVAFVRSEKPQQPPERRTTSSNFHPLQPKASPL